MPHAPESCPHNEFESLVEVARVEALLFHLSITVACYDCGQRFHFRGIPEIGINTAGVTTDVTGTELRVGIAPAAEGLV